MVWVQNRSEKHPQPREKRPDHQTSLRLRIYCLPSIKPRWSRLR